MPTTARVVCDSISESGQRITTLVLEYPRIIHSEFMTHRMFSRNASSSRAIPVEKQIERVEKDPFIPTYWGANQKGMQANRELDDNSKDWAKQIWIGAKNKAVDSAKDIVDYNVHKQLANRLLEPFSYIQVVVTATEWDNFFLQRLDKNAQPEIQELARVMKEAMNNSTPKLLKTNEWHLPFVDELDKVGIINHFTRELKGLDLDFKPGLIYQKMKVTQDAKNASLKISVARCARISYGLNERGWGDIEKDLALYEMLLTNNHWSPFEHQATPMKNSREVDDVWERGITHMDATDSFWSGNFKEWIQNRQLIQQTHGI